MPSMHRERNWGGAGDEALNEGGLREVKLQTKLSGTRPPAPEREGDTPTEPVLIEGSAPAPLPGVVLFLLRGLAPVVPGGFFLLEAVKTVPSCWVKQPAGSGCAGSRGELSLAL